MESQRGKKESAKLQNRIIKPPDVDLDLVRRLALSGPQGLLRNAPFPVFLLAETFHPIDRDAVARFVDVFCQF